jgi:peptidyl-prolyl cis-trans isomerase A (cyclophilin A)
MKRRDFLTAVAAMTATPALAQSPVRVKLSTSAGDIVIELAVAQAPITTANFLRYVDQKRYDGTSFYRASRAPGAPEYGLIQGGLNGDPSRVLKPIRHEPTSRTGLSHKDGTLSMGRFAPGSATSDFFILIGDSPEFDADPKAGGDNQGFAAFGQVVEGMEVVRKILAGPVAAKGGTGAMKGEMLKAPVRIISARRQ